MKIGPGMAPKAKLYAYRVFGCAGSTDVVGEAIDMAADPNGDGDTSDHVDVINMSLGSDYGSPQDGDSVVTNDAARAGHHDVGRLRQRRRPLRRRWLAGQRAGRHRGRRQPGRLLRGRLPQRHRSRPRSPAPTPPSGRSPTTTTNDPDLSGDVVRVTRAGQPRRLSAAEHRGRRGRRRPHRVRRVGQQRHHPSLWLGRSRRQPGGSRGDRLHLRRRRGGLLRRHHRQRRHPRRAGGEVRWRRHPHRAAGRTHRHHRQHDAQRVRTSSTPR